ncbi:MAG: Fic family protein [Candidatus Woesearchaeota archaeon]
MNIIKKKRFYYLGHSFRKDNKVVYREKYLGKEVPGNITEIKTAFLEACRQEGVFKKLKWIQKNFQEEWKRYPESIKKKVLVDLSIDFTYNSNAIEGSTITLDETEDLIKQKISPHKPLKDVQETINHSKVFLQALNGKKSLSLGLILEWHQQLFNDTKSDISGRLREYLVRVGSYLAPDWQDLPGLLKDYFKWCVKNNKTMNPVELAARAHYKFEKIHPFGDGNGRVGRLIIAYTLRKHSYPLLTIEYKKRKSYYHALSKTEEDFVNYFIRRYLNYHKKYLRNAPVVSDQLN